MASDLAHLYAKYVEWSDHSYGDYDDAVHDYIKALRAEVERLRADPRLALDWSHLLWAADHNEQELELDKERRAAGRLNERDHEWRKELAAVFRDALAGEGDEDE